jgi:hypothetical protein
MDDRHGRMHRAMALCLLIATTAVAQPDGGAEKSARHVTVHVAERLTLDDNLYRLPVGLDPSLVLGEGARREDLINSASLAVAGRWSQGEQRVAFDSDVASNRFDDNANLDNVSGRGALQWNWRFGSRWSGQMGARREQALAGFANAASLERDLLDTRAYVGDFSLQLGPRWSALLRARAATTSHDNEQRRRDNTEERSAAVGIEYRTPRASTLEWQLREVRARFPEQALLGNAVSDYDERASNVRVGYAFTEKLRLEADAGYVRRSYAFVEDGNFDGGVWSAVLEWVPTPTTRLTFERFRDVRAHLEAQTNHFVSNGESVAASWLPIAKLGLTLRASREQQRYIGAAALDLAADARRDTPTTANFIVTYRPRERASLEVAVRDERRESNNLRFDYLAAAVSVAGEIRF